MVSPTQHDVTQGVLRNSLGKKNSVGINYTVSERAHMAYLGSEIRSRIDSLKNKVHRAQSTNKSRQTTVASSYHKRK